MTNTEFPPNEPDEAHRHYLVCAVAAEIASWPGWAEFVQRHSDRWGGWCGVISRLADFGNTFYDAWLHMTIVWGETHDQYNTLEALAAIVLAEGMGDPLGAVGRALEKGAIRE